MTNSSTGTVSVSRRIAAPVGELFALLTDPTRHPSIDGSGMLRDGSGNQVVSAAGDVFTMKMHNDEMGDYEMSNHVVEYELNKRVVWEPVMSGASRAEDMADIGVRAGHRWGYQLEPDGPDATIVTEIFDCTQAPERLRTVLDNGNRWLPTMTTTLERLDEQYGHLSDTSGSVTE
jgi:uncharacterized protein YndB with AHSA1/START domain